MKTKNSKARPMGPREYAAAHAAQVLAASRRFAEGRPTVARKRRKLATLVASEGRLRSIRRLTRRLERWT